MTPATASDMWLPDDDEEDEEDEEEEEEEEEVEVPKASAEQVPVELPQALHQSAKVSTLIADILLAKSVQVMLSSVCPNNGYTVGSEILLVVPLCHKNLTNKSSVAGNAPE